MDKSVFYWIKNFQIDLEQWKIRVYYQAFVCFTFTDDPVDNLDHVDDELNDLKDCK